MTARFARALRALADRLSPPQPTVIHTHVSIDGRAVARAVADGPGDEGALR